MTHRFLRPVLAVLGAALLLSGCEPAFVVRCPGVAILSDLSKRTVLKPGAASSDPSALLYTVELVGADTTCASNRRAGQTDSDVTFHFRATRAPSTQPARYTVPYFMGVNQGERILNRRAFNATLTFAPGASVVTFSVTLDSNVLKVEDGKLPVEYQFLAGLEISDAEKAYLQTMSRYTP